MQTNPWAKSARKQSVREIIAKDMMVNGKPPNRIGTLAAPEGEDIMLFRRLYPDAIIDAYNFETRDKGTIAALEKLRSQIGGCFMTYKADILELIDDKYEQSIKRKTKRGKQTYEETHYDAFFFDFTGLPTAKPLNGIGKFIHTNSLVHLYKPTVVSWTFSSKLDIHQPSKKNVINSLLRDVALDEGEPAELTPRILAEMVDSAISDFSDCGYSCMRLLSAGEYTATDVAGAHTMFYGSLLVCKTDWKQRSQPIESEAA